MKPVIEVERGSDGTPASAVAVVGIAAPRSRVWTVVTDVERYVGVVPMIAKVQKTGDRVQVHLKFKISLFSVGFDFVANATLVEERSLELVGISGDLGNLRIRYDLDDAEGGGTTLRAFITFDPFSLGWLAKYFLKHHPEIRYGIFPGCAYGLADSMKKAAERP